MKRIIQYLLIALVGTLFIAVIDVGAQTTTDNATIKYGADFSFIYKDVAIDSAESIYSQAFKLDNYNGGSSLVLYCTVNTDNADSVLLAYEIWGNSIDSDSTAYWTVISPVDTVTSSTLARATETISTHTNWYKVKVINMTGAQANTFDLGIVAIIKED
jgi:hypothetical protein